MRREWRSFIENCGIPVKFLYRDEFRADLEPRNIALPVILLGWGAPQPEVLVSAAELSALSDVTELMALVQSRLALQKP